MKSIKKWVWQHSDYPDFPYDFKKLDSILSEVIYNTGVLEGVISTLQKDDTTPMQIETVTNEIISSSLIEGEVLSRDSVRSSVHKKFDKSFELSKDLSTHHTDGLVDILIDSSSNHKPLTKERLHGWHNALFPNGYSGLVKIKVASYRSEDMSIVSGQGIREKTHYEAPQARYIDMQMKNLLEYINTSTDNVYIKSAIAHLWFVIIHPYDDGNGRIARAVTNYVLSKGLRLDHNYFSISKAVMDDKKSYYEILEKSNNLFFNKEYDFTRWILWHTSMINKALNFSLKQIDTIVQKAKFWDKARGVALNDKQIKVLNKLLDAPNGKFEGGLNNKKYRSITGTTNVTASRHIQDLVEKGLLKVVEGYGGRSTRYEILY